jgi:O-antigen ligase
VTAARSYRPAVRRSPFAWLGFAPVIVPLAAYAFAIPFDNLLQTGSGTITKFLGGLCAVVMLVAMLDRRRWIAPPLAIAGWAVFLAWSVTSLMWADDPAFGAQSLLQVLELFALFAIMAMLRLRRGEVGWIALGALAGGVACAGYGIFMYAVGHVQRTDALSQRLDLALGTGTFINADHYAGSLVFPVALALVGFLRLRGWQRIAAGCAFFILFAAICVSATRGALVAVVAVAVYLAIVERRRWHVLALGACGLIASAAVPNVWLRFVDADQGGFGGRFGIWAIGWHAYLMRPLAGAGTGNFQLAYAETYLATRQSGLFTHRWMEFSHNLIVNTGVELGIVGVVVILVAWVLQFRLVAKIPRDEPLGALRSAVEAGTIGLFLVAMTVDLMWYKYLWIAFMIAVLARNASLAERT